MVTVTLDDFLRARLADDQTLAQATAAAYPGWWRWDGTGHGVKSEGHSVVYDESAYDDNVPFMLRWQPLRVLAECEAKRKRIETLLDDRWVGNPMLRDRLLGFEALPYADHPDFQVEWCP